MDFELQDQQKALQEGVRVFVENEFTKEIVDSYELHNKEGFSWDLYKKLADLGILKAPIPEKYGGLGLDTLTCVLIMEELSRGWTGASLSMFAVPCTLYADPIIRFGTKEQIEKYITPLIKGEVLGAFALTEPNAGSWSANQQTRAELEGDHYILNGEKIFITNCGLAKYSVVFARTQIVPDKLHKGISAFIIDSESLGFSWKVEDKLGQKVSLFGSIILQDCKVPIENLLGSEGEGTKIALSTLDNGRVFIAAQALGIAQRAFEEAVKYAKERVQFSKPISSFGTIQEKIANMKVDLLASRHLTYHAAWLKDNQKPFSQVASLAKLHATEAACRITDSAVQIHGGYGYCKEYPVSRLWVEARALPLYEGTSEIQRIIIAKEELK